MNHHYKITLDFSSDCVGRNATKTDFQKCIKNVLKFVENQLFNNKSLKSYYNHKFEVKHVKVNGYALEFTLYSNASLDFVKKYLEFVLTKKFDCGYACDIFVKKATARQTHKSVSKSSTRSSTKSSTRSSTTKSKPSTNRGRSKSTRSKSIKSTTKPTLILTKSTRSTSSKPKPRSTVKKTFIIKSKK